MANELGGWNPSGHDGRRAQVTPGRSFTEGITNLFSSWGRPNQMRAQNTRRNDQPHMMQHTHSNSALPAYTSEQTSPQPALIPPSPVGNGGYRSSLIDGPYTVDETSSTSSGTTNVPITREDTRSTSSNSAATANEQMLKSVAEKSQWRTKLSELYNLMFLKPIQ